MEKGCAERKNGGRLSMTKKSALYSPGNEI